MATVYTNTGEVLSAGASNGQAIKFAREWAAERKEFVVLDGDDGSQWSVYPSGVIVEEKTLEGTTDRSYR